MRALALVALSMLAWPAHAGEVAKVFGSPVPAAELGLTDEASRARAARQLRERVLKDAIPRFVAANKLQATTEEVAQYQRWEADFRRKDEARRAARLAELEKTLAAPEALEPRQREQLGKEREVLLSLKKHEAQRPAPDAAVGARVHARWIEAYKVRKALYEKYGGRVGITKWGPDPAGATEALLREHERKGELEILDAALAREFWAQLAAEPRLPASKPEHYDFTYYWLKDPPR